GPDDRVGGHDHVAIHPVSRPRPVPGPRARDTQAGHVETAELTPLDELVARRDLVEHTGRRVAGAQQIETEEPQTRVGAGLRDDRADARRHVNAARAHRHLAGRDRDAEHAGALAPADEREGHGRLSSGAGAETRRSRAWRPSPAGSPWSRTRTRGSARGT